MSKVDAAPSELPSRTQKTISEDGWSTQALSGSVDGKKCSQENDTKQAVETESTLLAEDSNR